MKRLIGTLLIAFLFISLCQVIPGSASKAQQETLPEEAFVYDVTGHPQAYTLSCEARAAVDWAAYFGVYINELEFIENLPVSDDPDLGFVGRINGNWGNIPPYDYGVHAPPIADLLRQYGLPAIAMRHLGWDDLRFEIASGRPVIVWVISDMWDGQAIPYTTQAGNQVNVAYYEHSMILIGYDQTTVTVVDPLFGYTKIFPVESFLKSWAVLEHMAVVAYEPEPTPTPEPTYTPTQTPTPLPTAIPTIIPSPTPTATPIGFYTVKAGDTLIGIAKHFNISWQTLTRHNDLQYPYFIYPGNVLRVD